MGLTTKDKGAVKWLVGGVGYNDLEEQYNPGHKEFCQLIQQPTDKSYAQIALTSRAGAVNLITDGGFTQVCGVNWTCGGAWNIAAGVASIIAGDGILSQVIGAKKTTLYKVTFTISGWSAGDIKIRICGGSYVTATGNGSYTKYVFSGVTGASIEINAPAMVTASIDSVTADEHSTVGIEVRHKTTDVVVLRDITGSNVVYYEDLSVADVQLTWANIVAQLSGAYKLCIFDKEDYLVEILKNGVFDNSNFWDIATDPAWTVGGGALQIDSAGGGGPGNGLGARGDFFANLSPGKKYILTCTCANLIGNVTVKIERTDLTLKSVGPIGGLVNGANEIEIDWVTEVLGGKRLIFVEDDSAAHAISIDDVSIKVQGAYSNSGVCSECFCLGQEWGGTMLLKWTNEDNAYGYIYVGTTMAHWVRVKARLKHPRWKKDIEMHATAVGKMIKLYSETYAIHVLAVEEMPDYLHEALALGLEHDDFRVDDDLYLSEEREYSPAWRKSTTVASVEVEGIKETQDNINKHC